MAEAEYGKDKKYAYLDQLTTEQLEELLRSDIESLESSNDGVISHVLEVIEQREKENPTGRLPDLEKSWAGFQKYYNTPEGEGHSLYPEGQNDLTSAERSPTPLRAMQKRRLRRVLVSAAAVICVIIITIPPALGYSSLFQMIAHWTAEQFNFSEPSVSPSGQISDSQNEGKFESLQDALSYYGISETVVPKWIPDDFQPQEIWTQNYPETGDIELSTSFDTSDDNIVITIYYHNGRFEKRYEKEDEAVEKYLSGSIDHYIFHNSNNITAAWYVGSLECSINTSLSETELRKIIDSIYDE